MSDLISRHAAIDAVLDRMNIEKYGRDAKPEEIRWTLEKLPPVQPKRGKWNCTDDIYENAECSCCKWDSGEAWSYAWANFNFCPSCGAKMER